MTPPALAKPNKPLCTLALCALAGFTVLLAAYVFRAPLLTKLAEIWVIDDPVTKADAIVVLGGKPDLRAVEAARLYHQGITPKILYMNFKLPPERENTHRLLLSNNVPEMDMQALKKVVSSTFEETIAVRAWLEETKAKTIIIPTDLFHTRRVRGIFRKTLKNSGTKIIVRAIQPKEYGVTNWWFHEQGLVGFQTELLKSVYYCLKY